MLRPLFSNSPWPFRLLPHPLKRSTSQPDTSSDPERLWTSWRSSSCFHRKTSRLVIHCSGGPDAIHSSPTCLASPVTFCLCQVCFKFLQECLSFLMIILGSAVAVERIFSGGRDTISLRRASLKPDTIRTLMLVKQRLRLARDAIQDIVGR